MAIEVDAMYRINADLLPDWAAEFDPIVFQAEHRDITLGPWRLTEEQLQA